MRVSRKYVNVSDKMADNVADNLTDIVRRVVSSLRNLPDGAPRSSSNQNSSSSTGSSSRSNNNSVEQELGQRFQLPRDPGNTRLPARSGRGRFVPYTTKNKKGKSKAKSAVGRTCNQ